MQINKKYLFKESIIATTIIILLTFLVTKIPFSLEYGKALHQGFADFDIYDLQYSGKNSNTRDPNIILIEIGNDRNEIGDQIELINHYQPKVIGIDATFEMPKDSIIDSKFLQITSKQNNLVFGKRFSDTPQSRIIPNLFEAKSNESGLINFIGNKYSVLRYFAPFIQFQEKEYPAFAVAIARRYDEASFQFLKARSNKKEIINYSGNLTSYTSFSKEDLINAHITGQLTNILKNKIVLLGFFVNSNTENNIYPILNDLYFSPLNERIGGKSYPDIYGVVIHANILSMVLNKTYATLASENISYFFAFLFTFLFNYYLIAQYHKKTHPSHAKFLIIQFFSIVILLYIFLLIFNWFLYKVPLEPILVCLVLCLEMLGLYKSLALWLHKKFEYKSVFTRKHII
ncbi:MAG TPA: CHASE2 domain-containing protein [Chitinophagaceae bacterium]|nr:CHASE2 domain-containing protein [Chitinophagaceae bacterium]